MPTELVVALSGIWRSPGAYAPSDIGRIIEEWCRDHNEERLHGALSQMTPGGLRLTAY